MANLLEAALGLLLVFFLPGYFLVGALFPRKGALDLEFDQVYRIALGMGLSLVIAILIGFALNALGTDPETGLGYIRASYLWFAFVLVSVVLFLVGWWRGAYPVVGRLHPALLRLPPEVVRSLTPGTKDPRGVLKLESLLKERETLLARIERYGEKARMPRADLAAHYGRRLKEARQRVEAINAELSELQGSTQGRREGAA